MILDRIFEEGPARDSYERTGRLIGNVMGIGVMLAMVWVVIREFV